MQMRGIISRIAEVGAACLPVPVAGPTGQVKRNMMDDANLVPVEKI